MAKHDNKPKPPGQMVIDTEVLDDEPVVHGSQSGEVHIHNAVISGIARIAALSVPGVSDLSAGVMEGIATALGTKRAAERGIKANVDGDFVSLEVHVIMDYGVRIPHVAYQVQTEVRRAIEQMTGKTVHDVKVLVQGVKLPTGKTVRTTEPTP